MQGLIISKGESNINSSNPENIVLDTRASGGMKKLPTMFFYPKDYTEIYTAPGPFPGSFFTYGRIRIKHGLGYPPAFSGYVVRYSEDNDNVSVQAMPVTTGFGTVIARSNDEEVIVEQCPPADDETGPYYIVMNVFIENLESDIV